MNQKKAYLSALIAVGLWSTVATAFKLALREINYTELLLFSSFFSFLALIIILFFQGKFRSLFSFNRKDIHFSLIMGFLNPFLYYIVLFKAYSLLPAQEALTLNYVWTLMVVLFSVVFLKQKISIKRLSALLISFLGVIIIAGHGDFSSLKLSDNYGVFLALFSTLVWAAYWIMNMKDSREEVQKLTLNFLFGFIFTLIYCLFSEGINIRLNVGIIYSAYIGLFEMGITFVIWLKALRYSETTAQVTNLVYLSPFLSLFIISMFLDERILPSTLAGLVLIISGILIQQRIKR